MKEIWINLELYIKSFLFLGIFSELLLIFLTIKKKCKKILFSRGTHVDAMWHARPRGSATRAHATPTRPNIHIYILYSLQYIAFCLSEANYYPLEFSLLLNPSDSFNFYRVGLSSTVFN